VHVAPKKVTALVVVLVVMNGQATAQEAAGETTGSISPPSSAIEKHANTSSHPTATEPTSSGIILVSKAPIEVLARPSSSAVVMYGFPAGRRFRLIGREAGFAQIQDLKSGATGWIDEASLEQSPRVPAVSVPSEPVPAPATHKATTASIERKPKTHVPAAPMLSEHKPAPRNHKGTTASAEPKPKTRVPAASMLSEHKSAPRSHKTTSAEPKPKTTKKDAKTTTPQTPKRHGIFGLRRNNAQGVLY
jgi:hypothetical protein